MELTGPQPRLAYFFIHFIVIKVFTLANGGHTGHSPQLITATIQQACLVFQFVRTYCHDTCNIITISSNPI
jgi:hypothetical protein